MSVAQAWQQKQENVVVDVMMIVIPVVTPIYTPIYTHTHFFTHTGRSAALDQDLLACLLGVTPAGPKGVTTALRKDLLRLHSLSSSSFGPSSFLHFLVPKHLHPDTPIHTHTHTIKKKKNGGPRRAVRVPCLAQEHFCRVDTQYHTLGGDGIVSGLPSL